MKKIENPFNKRKNYYCFGCSKQNQFGLQMDFFEDGDEIVCIWDPKEHFQGYDFILHGGIQSTLADEIASWVVFIKLKTAGVTTKLELQYKKPLYTNKGKIILRGKLKELNKRIAEIEVVLFNDEETLCSMATVHYYLVSQEKAKAKLGYPEYQEFFQPSSLY